MITCIGDLVEDVVVVAPEGVRIGTDSPARVERHRGGSAANVAVAACSIGGRARFVGNVGDDPLGDQLLDQLTAAGVDISVSRQGRSGSIVAIITADGERSFLTDRGAAGQLTAAPAGWLDDTSVVHVPMYSLLADPTRTTTLAMLGEARELGVPISLDASSTGALADAGLERSVGLITEVGPDVLFCNRDEAELLEVHGARRLATTTIIKNGAEPTMIFSPSAATSYPASRVEQVLDTTGAGDAFAAGYLVSRFDEHVSEEAAISIAHGLSARTLTTFGATPRSVDV